MVPEELYKEERELLENALSPRGGSSTKKVFLSFSISSSIIEDAVMFSRISLTMLKLRCKDAKRATVQKVKMLVAITTSTIENPFRFR